MKSSTRSFSVRKNFIVLVLLSIGGIVLICWFLLMLLAVATGEPILQDKSQLLLDIFMTFAFPVFLAVFVSIFSLAFAVLARQKWWISIPASILFLGLPLIATIITWLGSWVARLFYIPSPEDAERTSRFLSMSIAPKEDKSDNDVNIDVDVEKIKKMKTLLDEGIITEDEFVAQKQKIIFGITNERTSQNLPRYFSIWQTTTAAAFGGFLAGAVLVSINFKRMGNHEQFKGGLIVGLIGHLIAVLISASTTMVFTGINPLLIIPVTFVYPIIIYLWQNETQKQLLAPLFTAKQARNESWWLVIGVVLLALVFIFLSVIPLVMIFAYFQPVAGN